MRSSPIRFLVITVLFLRITSCTTDNDLADSADPNLSSPDQPITNDTMDEQACPIRGNPYGVFFSSQYPILEQLSQHLRVEGVECPAGTIPDTLYGCLPGANDEPCILCIPECYEHCTPDEVCFPDIDDGSCHCHPSLKEVDGICVAADIVADPSFEDCSQWQLNTYWANGVEDAAQIDIRNGRLLATVSQNCSGVAASTLMRLPPLHMFPEGAALVFDYTASKSDPTSNPPEISVYSYTLTTGMIPPSETWTEWRGCLLLTNEPQLVELQFRLQAQGPCVQRYDHRLEVDNLRIVADNSCRR